jgi:hypothetical protein
MPTATCPQTRKTKTMQRKSLPMPFRRIPLLAALMATALVLPAASASEYERIEAGPGVFL